MSPITTQMCKDFLVSTFNQTQAKDWKRLSKSNDKANKTNIVRIFSHPTIGEINVLEAAGLLSIVNKQTPSLSSGVSTSQSSIAPISNPIDNIINIDKCSFEPKIFSQEDIAGAEKVLKAYYSDNSDNYYEVREKVKASADWKKYFHAFPAHFSFCFPLDINDDDVRPKQGLNTPVHSLTNDFYSIFFSLDSPIKIKGESISNDCFREDGPMSELFDFASECDITTTTDGAGKNYTLQDLCIFLFNQGFNYKPAYNQCYFKKEIKEYISAEQEKKLLCLNTPHSPTMASPLKI